MTVHRLPINAWYGDQTVDVQFPDDWNVIAHWPGLRALWATTMSFRHCDNRGDSLPFGSSRVAGADP